MIAFDCSLALVSAGINMEISMAVTDMTTRTSINVKAVGL